MSVSSVAELRKEFLLDPTVTFLNHGSFGACPKPVFEEYQRWQRELEFQPVEFIGRRHDGLLEKARIDLAAYFNTAPDNLVYVPNATSGLNVIARSLPLERGDEILTTDHEYGALDMTWEWMCGKTGATYVKHHVPVPVTTHADFVESFWSAVTPRTKVIFLSHITSPTALIFPVKEICKRARAAGILTVVDGAHAPGQIPVDLTDLDVDIYSGNHHKWLCAPKGSGFLYVRPEHQEWVEANTISWGWRPGSTFITRNEYQGTRDIAQWLSTPAAIRFQQEHDWDTVRARCHGLARLAREEISERFNQEPITPDQPDEWFAQMVTSVLPSTLDLEMAKSRLYDEFRIEVPFGGLFDLKWVRVSFQGYNDENDLDRLIEGLTAVIR
ncbi:aminotransferase class V-fold PLP-dependent enzyme [soil metagenome]